MARRLHFRIGMKHVLHGRCRTPEYKVWQGLRKRCANPKEPGYKNYGGRGIYVSKAWNESFLQFLADMGERPSKHYSIERQDNNGPYSAENCVWATRTVQNRNNRRNRVIEFDGRTQLMTDWAREKGLAVSTLYRRIKEGWTLRAALCIPARTPSTLSGGRRLRLGSGGVRSEAPHPRSAP